MGNRVDELVDQLKRNQKSVSFSDLEFVCQYYFGKPRKCGGSHCVYKMPWPGDPRVNIQNDRGKAKAYQVKQVLQAVEKFKSEL